MTEQNSPPGPVERPSGARRSLVSRGRLLRDSLIGLGALIGGGAGAAELLASPDPAPSPAGDREVLQAALLIEQLQAAFYAEALKAGALTGEVRQFAQVVGAEERAHVSYITGVLGSAAPAAPRFQFGSAVRDQQKFMSTAVLLEDTGSAAYVGQALNLTPAGLASAARIVSVEARHAAWARSLAGQVPAPAPSETPISLSAAKAALKPYLA